MKKALYLSMITFIVVFGGCASSNQASHEIIAPDTQCQVCSGSAQEEEFLQNSNNRNNFLIK